MTAEIHTIDCETALQMIVDCPWGMGRVSATGHFEWINNAYLNILGCPGSPSLVIGTHYEDWTHPDDIQEDTRQAIEVAAGTIPGYLCKKRYRVRGPAGRYRWGLLSVIGLWDHTGQFQGYNVQFMPVDDYELQSSIDWTTTKKVMTWLWTNRATVSLVMITLASLFSALIAGDWQKLFQIIQKTEELQQSLPPSP